MIGRVQVIAEIKTQSPFGFVSQRDWKYLFNIANKVGDMIAVHTDPRWGGSIQNIKIAKENSDKLIFAKGIHASDYQLEEVFEAGADYALTVDRLSEKFKEKCFYEPTSLGQLLSLPRETRVVWNARNLTNNEKKVETFEEARRIWKGFLVQASYIKTIDDIHPGANAILVGTYLEDFYDSYLKYQEST